MFLLISWYIIWILWVPLITGGVCCKDWIVIIHTSYFNNTFMTCLLHDCQRKHQKSCYSNLLQWLNVEHINIISSDIISFIHKKIKSCKAMWCSLSGQDEDWRVYSSTYPIDKPHWILHPVSIPAQILIGQWRRNSERLQRKLNGCGAIGANVFLH